MMQADSAGFVSTALELRDGIPMKISARNILRGKVVDVRKDAVAAQIQVDVGACNTVTATITADSAERLALAPGKDVMVVIKASDVMLAVDDA